MPKILWIIAGILIWCSCTKVEDTKQQQMGSDSGITQSLNSAIQISSQVNTAYGLMAGGKTSQVGCAIDKHIVLSELELAMVHGDICRLEASGLKFEDGQKIKFTEFYGKLFVQVEKKTDLTIKVCLDAKPYQLITAKLDDKDKTKVLSGQISSYSSSWDRLLKIKFNQTKDRFVDFSFWELKQTTLSEGRILSNTGDSTRQIYLGRKKKTTEGLYYDTYAAVALMKESSIHGLLLPETGDGTEDFYDKTLVSVDKTSSAAFSSDLAVSTAPELLDDAELVADTSALNWSCDEPTGVTIVDVNSSSTAVEACRKKYTYPDLNASCSNGNLQDGVTATSGYSVKTMDAISTGYLSP